MKLCVLCGALRFRPQSYKKIVSLFTYLAFQIETKPKKRIRKYSKSM